MKRFLTITLFMAMAVWMQAQMRSFPYPEMPATLTTIEERGAYLLQHYWDNYDFADTTLIDCPEISEQGFANYVDLLPRFQTNAEESIGIFAQRAYGNTAAPKVSYGFETITEHYLADPNSPMRNEELYIMFLQAQVEAMQKNGHDASRPASLLANAMKNRPGYKAADFSFTTRSGLRSTLYATEAKRLLLVFYDPECDHCSEILRMLREDATLCSQVGKGELQVLAVYTEGNRPVWHDTCGSMPKDWTVAIDESGIVEHQIYDIPAMPVLYLLDADKTVLLKDPSIDELLSRISGGE